MRLAIVLIAATLCVSSTLSEEATVSSNQQQAPPPVPVPAPSTEGVPTQGGRPTTDGDRRPSIWSRTVHQHRQAPWIPSVYRKPYLRRSTEVRPLESFDAVLPSLGLPSMSFSSSKEENEILQSETMIGLKDFANQLVNETARMFKSVPRARSYPSTEVGSEDPSQHHQQQFWGDEKDQTYHASSYSGVDYEPPTSYHHPFHHTPPMHYMHTAPQKKDDTLFTKVALIALLKLILAKLKAIGFLKVLLVIMLKVPLFFFKMLIVFKGFKFLKLLSIPFLILAFGLPFLPLIPFFIFSFIPFLFLAPLALPLLLPLLMFLPIVPVTTLPTAPTAPALGRRRRDVPDMPQSVTANQTWSIMDEKWKAERQKKTFRTRSRPASASRRFFRYDPHLTEEHNENLIDLTQRVVQSQQCLERAACEIAKYNDSKIYQTAVIWALGKLHLYAPPTVQRRIEQYSHAYETGAQRRSADYCAEKFKCQRPKVFLVQGPNSYNLI